MKKKRRTGRRSVKHGLNAGYPEYRYGPEAPITLPPVAPRRPVFGSQQIEALADSAAQFMNTWTSTRFQHEGACRHGFRSALCIEGHSWSRSDATAAVIVEKALKRMGANRPTWEEGQPEYVEPRENCGWCKRLIPDDMLKARYCCEVCASKALRHREFRIRSNDDKQYREAFQAVQQALKPKQPCGHCGKLFRSRHADRKYCSKACGGAAKVVIEARNCAHCQRSFRPRSDKALFCSKVCYTEHGATTVHERTCKWCGAPFQSMHSTADYCKPGCRALASQLRRGAWMPKVLTPPVFDHLIARAA